jgi:Protein of unknown function (DUF3551)
MMVSVSPDRGVVIRLQCVPDVAPPHHPQETFMRLTLASLALIGAALLGGATPGLAQSAYDYPWCALRGDRGGGGQSCYFSSYRQCMQTISGIGGTCIRSPYYHGPQPRREQRYERY